MNLFILSLNFAQCAEYMIDKHVSKMILEAVQMLCTAVHLLDPDADIDEQLYKATHKNHPVSIWIRESQENFIWTLNMIDAMHTEWKYRYGHPIEKMHKSYALAIYISYILPSEDKFPHVGLTPFAQAMPDEYKCENAVDAYRAYYQSKQGFASWKSPREKPDWYIVQTPSSPPPPISSENTEKPEKPKRITIRIKIHKHHLKKIIPLNPH